MQQQPSTATSRPNLPPLIFSRVTNPDQRRSTPQPISRQLTSPHTPVNPQTPPSISRRLCTESPRSALDSPATTLAGEDDDEYQWTEDQISTVTRVCPFPVRLLQKTWPAAHQIFWQTLQDGYVGRPPRCPQAPYSLRYVPEHLVGKWARALKRTTDWPHSVRSIRKKLKEMSVKITDPVQDITYLDDEDAAEALMDEEARERPISPRKQLSERDKDRLKRSVFHYPHSLPPIIHSPPRSAARFHDVCDSVLSPKFHPYQRPGALSPALSGSSTRSFKHSGRGLSPSPILYSSSNDGSPEGSASKSGKSPTPFRSMTPSPTSFGLEAGYDDPPVLSGLLETSSSKFTRPEFTQFRSPVRPGLDLPETPAGPPTTGYLRMVDSSPALTSSCDSNLSASLSGSPFSSASFATPTVGGVNASIEKLKLTPKPSRAIQRSQSFTARPGDGVKRAPTYGGGASNIAELFIPPSNVSNVPATLPMAEDGEGPLDHDATVKSRGAMRRKHTTTAPAPSAWDTRMKAGKRPRTISGSDTEGWRSLVPLTSPSSPPTPKAGISRGGVRVKRARKDDDTTPTQPTINTGNDAMASRLTRSSKKLSDAMSLGIPSSGSSREPASLGSLGSLGSPMATPSSKAPIGHTTKRNSTSHRRATSLLASGSATITREQLQDENQDTSMIVIEQPERRSSSPTVTRNVRTAQFPPKMRRTKNQSGGDAL